MSAARTIKPRAAHKAEQLPFDFPVLNSQSMDDLAVGASNQDAVRLLNSWPDWPHHALLVQGPEACGKTHLARVFEKRTGAVWLNGEHLTPQKGEGAIIVDNADKVKDEDALFHLFNWVREKDGFLLLTARSAPSGWQLGLPDLISRLNATPSVAISMPDESLLAAVMIKQFTDRQLQIDEAVIKYLLPRMERSFEAARAMVARLDAKALNTGKRITVPLARETLEDDLRLL